MANRFRMEGTSGTKSDMAQGASMASLLGLNGPFLGEEGARRYRPILPLMERPFPQYQAPMGRDRAAPVHMQVAAYPSPTTTCSTPDTPPEVRANIDAQRN